MGKKVPKAQPPSEPQPKGRTRRTCTNLKALREALEDATYQNEVLRQRLRYLQSMVVRVRIQLQDNFDGETHSQPVKRSADML